MYFCLLHDFNSICEIRQSSIKNSIYNDFFINAIAIVRPRDIKCPNLHLEKLEEFLYSNPLPVDTGYLKSSFNDKCNKEAFQHIKLRFL